ncbi:hypothetical protein [Paludisphaera soli]|uniref:hypothetical protein n=1 Tax=Paludisphaera soli TaxID=2712865 RepID=UPI0013EB715A|nr:hypothetical protein [Paludisphaera soli]
MSGPEILLILVAVFAAGRVVARSRDSRTGQRFRQSGPGNKLAIGLFALAGIQGFVGVVWAVRWLGSLLEPQRGWGPVSSGMAAMSGTFFMVTAFLLWLGVRLGRGGGLSGRFARAARAAYGEFFASTDAEAKPKPDAASRLLD